MVGKPSERHLEFLSAIALGAVALAVSGCTKSGSVPSSRVGTPLSLTTAPAPSLSSSRVLIDYPAPGNPDPLNLRGCSLSGDYGNMPCRLIGMKGPIRKITWKDDQMNVVEASIEFDRSGKLQTICRRGHVDFQGWHCSNAPFANHNPPPQTKLDERGRILQQLHFQFDPVKLDTCTYDDTQSPPLSECRVEELSFGYTFDPSGRALTYSTRWTAAPGEYEDRRAELEKAYKVDITFTYKNDAYGNWTEFYAYGRDADTNFAMRLFDYQTLTIDYF
jgi:hypothetical protein